MDRKKILFLMHELSMGGAQRVTSNLANEFSQKNYDVHMVLFTKKGELVESLNLTPSFFKNSCSNRLSNKVI